MSYFKTNTNSSSTDEELIKKFRFSHDKIYLGELFLRYTPYVYGVALNRLKHQGDAEELTLTVFNKISSDLKRIEVPNFSKWLYDLVLNLCNVEFKKKSATEEESKMILIDELSDNEGDMFINTNNSKTPNTKIDAVNLRIAIDTLNESQKICIDYFYIQNKSYQEVAEITGYSVNQVKTNIQNGKRLLKTYLENRSN